MLKIFIVVAFVITCNCKTVGNERFTDNKDKRFLIPVFQYSKYDREKNLELTQSFAKEWKDASGFEYFIKDKKIAEGILRSGSLLPSTNYSIDCEFHEPGAKIVMVCSLKDLENGELIASDSIQGSGIFQLANEMKTLAKNLYSSR